MDILKTIVEIWLGMGLAFFVIGFVKFRTPVRCLAIGLIWPVFIACLVGEEIRRGNREGKSRKS